jgi:hypothetical protein
MPGMAPSEAAYTKKINIMKNWLSVNPIPSALVLRMPVWNSSHWQVKKECSKQ